MYPPTVIKINIMTTVDMMDNLLSKYWARRIIINIQTNREITKSKKYSGVCSWQYQARSSFYFFHCNQSRKMLITLQFSEIKTWYYLPTLLAFVQLKIKILTANNNQLTSCRSNAFCLGAAKVFRHLDILRTYGQKPWKQKLSQSFVWEEKQFWTIKSVT